MSIPLEKIEAAAAILVAGGAIISDGDGTIFDFTASPDETTIAPATLEAIRELQSMFRPNVFIPSSGRPERALRAVFERSSVVPLPIPMVSDNGAVYTDNNSRTETLSAIEREFMDTAKARINEFMESLPAEQRKRIAVEMSVAGINLNTNILHAELDEHTADNIDTAINKIMTDICEGMPTMDDKPCFTIHHPPGHGLAIRSLRITKKMGLEDLIEKGIIPKDVPLIFLGDEMKRGGNDVEIARFVQERSGMAIQVKHLDPLRAFPDENRAITPDAVLIEPVSVAPFLKQVMERAKEMIADARKAAPNERHNFTA